MVDLKVKLALGLLSILLSILVFKIVKAIKIRREWRTYFKRGNVPQVPVKSFLFGNLFDLIGKGKNIEMFDEYHKKLGKTFGTFYGPYPWAFTCDADLVQRIFVTEGNKFLTTNQFKMPFITELSLSVAQLPEPQWRPLRKALNPSFTNKQMKSDNVYKDMQASIDKLIASINKYPVERQADGGEGRVVDMLYSCRKFTIDLIFRAAYAIEDFINWEPNSDEPILDKLIESSHQIGGPLVVTSILIDGLQKHLGKLIRFTELGRNIKFFQSVISKSLAERRKMAPEKIKADRKMMDSIMEAVEATGFDEDHLRSNLFFVFLAGFDTTGNTLAVTLWLLALHPEIQDKLRAEVMSKGDTCEYLVWCIKEALRVYPAAPTGIGRELPEDIEHKGMKFFKGSTIVMNIWTIHKSKEYWGEDADVYRPERFGEPFKNPAQYAAFALGPRNCLGVHFAMLEMRIVIARLIANYRVEICPTSPKEIRWTSQNLITLSVKGPIDLRFIELKSEQTLSQPKPQPQLEVADE